MLAALSATAGDRLALVIGNDDYSRSNLSTLSQARADARAIGKRLGELGFEVIALENADRPGVLAGLVRLEERLSARAGQGEVALIYYAGHGAQHTTRDDIGNLVKQPWLLPVDARIQQPSDVESYGLPLGRLRAILMAYGWKAGVLVLDMCRNDLFAGGRPPPGIERAAMVRGLEKVSVVNGLLIAYATAEGEVAREQQGASNSVYTSALLEQLGQPGLDLYQVFNNTALNVQRRDGGRQRPELMVSALEPIWLARSGVSQVPTAPIAGVETGSIVVEVTPSDAEVWLDEAKLPFGVTTIPGLSPKAYALRGVKAGYEEASDRAYVVAGQTNRVSMRLKLIEGATPGALSDSPERQGAGESSHSRWTLEGSDFVLDSRTGRRWARTDNGADINVQDAVSWCRAMGEGWRLPSPGEFESLFDDAHAAITCGLERCVPPRCRSPFNQPEMTCKVPPLFTLSSYQFWTGKTGLPSGRVRQDDSITSEKFDLAVGGSSTSSGAGLHPSNPARVGVRALCVN